MQGLTEGIRVALRTSRKPLTPADVEEHLVAVGYPLSTYTNPRSAIYTILSRLVQSGEAKAKSLADGKAGYEWIHRFPRLAKSDRDK